MKVIMVMFDSLNRHMLPPYGNPESNWIHAPNFSRLAQRTVRFDAAYVCSMPCMPARRELHTGRPNFLHRAWGPLEPFDDSMPELLKNAPGGGVHSHLATDHYHYFEDGGATYHNRYKTWKFFRGHEGDPFIGQVAPPKIPDCVPGRSGPMWDQDWVNRPYLNREDLQPQPQTFRAGLDFIRRNHTEDKWFLQIETFDPHEPFFSQQKYKDLYAKHYDQYKGRHFDWPPYRKLTNETPEEIAHIRTEYAALLSMCDAYLGEVLKTMDELDLWKDTMLIVCTDHGFMLGEHECWAKIWQPFYEEVARTPLFIWDPRCGKKNESRQSLVQMIDFAPTILEFFNLPIPPDMTGKPLRDTIAHDTPVRQAALFGIHGGQINVTDGRYVYMRARVTPDNQPLYHYTLMPTRMRNMFHPEEFATGKIELSPPLSFTKGAHVLKLFSGWTPGWEHPDCAKNQLFDLQSDPHEEHPLTDPALEQKMITHMLRLMHESDAPPEQYQRLGLPVQ